MTKANTVTKIVMKATGELQIERRYMMLDITIIFACVCNEMNKQIYISIQINGGIDIQFMGVFTSI